ncbi:MAG: 4Fe-4S dicluster domain-containing protein, partial [Candidatus Omnitrophica bacterium]|nr:4Fe-4S dicluster domain-containing protein [Candidatus Omnitrophota bacterium]
PALDRRARYLKYFFLLTLLAATFILGNTSAANIEPFVTLFCGHGTRLAWALLILMLILSIFRFRFWCVYLCPVGALTGLTARLALFQIRLKENCYQCRQCSSICPVQAISHKPDSATTVVVDNAECILCGRCIRGCPEGKLTLSVCHEKTRRAV